MRKYLYITIFISGMASLAVEMAASRLLGNFFGTSNLVWASIIGLILIYLAAGYFLGGRWADRSPNFTTFFNNLLWASFLIGIVPFISRPILRFASNAFDQLQIGILLGSFISVLVLLCVPITLLGTISPFALRLAVEDTQNIGRISGKISAISTIGSFLGTFLPVLLLIPLIGTYRTFLSISGLLMLTALGGLFLTSGIKSIFRVIWMPIILILLTIFGFPGNDKITQGQVFETESAYNYIQVLENNGYYMLRLNEGQGIHSVYHPVHLNYYGPWEQVLIAPFFNLAPYSPSQVKNIAIVGLAAGTTARQAVMVYPGVQVDGFEIDPKIVEAGFQFFNLEHPDIHVFTEDGRWGLEQSQQKYQIISVDAYRPPYIPPHLTTQEFFQIVFDHLTEDGVMVINVGRAPDDRRLINALGTTIRTIFPSIYVVDVPGSLNSILFATVQPTTQENLLQNLVFLAESTTKNQILLVETLNTAIANLQPTPPVTEIFTDDRSPIEWLTNDMVLRYLLAENGELIQ